MAIIFYIKTAEAREEWFNVFYGRRYYSHDRKSNSSYNIGGNNNLKDSEICNGGLNSTRSSLSSVNRISESFETVNRDSLNIRLVTNEVEVISPIAAK